MFFARTDGISWRCCLLGKQRSIDGPHLIITYCALLALAVLRDDYTSLDRPALARMVGACQVSSGGSVHRIAIFVHRRKFDTNDRFGTMPGVDDADLRMTYCAFVVCALLDDWSCIDLPRAISYIHRCRVRHPPLPKLIPLNLLLRAADVRRRVRTDAKWRIARRTNILRTRSAAPRTLTVTVVGGGDT